MAQLILQEGPKNLTLHISGITAETIDVSALNPPCDGLVLVESQPTPDAAGVLDGPTTSSLWRFSDNNQHMYFARFGGIKDGLGNWTLTPDGANTGVFILSFDKVHATHPYPN